MAEAAPSAWSFLTHNAVTATLKDVYDGFSERRAALGLSNPGTVENINREMQKDVSLSGMMFQGLRADLTKVFSMDPIFRVSHAFTMGSGGNMPPYAFSSMFGSNDVFMQGNLQSDGGLVAVANYRLSPSLVTKANAQIMPGGQGMLQLDNEYTGQDFTLSLKSLNPSYLEGGLTGIFIGSYLQSITPGLALGLETVWQRAGLDARPETALSYFARYKSKDWIASAQLQAQGVLSASYWRKLSDKVDAGVNMDLQFAPSGNPMLGGQIQKQGVTTVGAKYEFRASTFRAQIDSTGKLACLLEKRVAMPIQLTFAGEIDQVNQQAKVGLAVSFEMATEEMMDKQESGDLSAASPPF